jgi:hypothetical protein
MSVVLFDTHAFVKRLTAAGMPEAQAEVLADEQARLIDERLATKADIAGLAAAMDSLAAKLEGFATKESVKADLAEAKSDILKWAFGAIGFQTLVLLGAIVALAKALH